MANPKCATCTKTVYPLEALSDQGSTWHKACFKCQGEENGKVCGLKLTVKTYTGIAGKIYCAKHSPKDKPTAVTVEGSMQLNNAKNAPKIATVNTNKRGDGMENPIQTTVDDNLSLLRAKEAHQQAQVLVSNEQRAKGNEKHGAAMDYTLSSQMHAPKVATINDNVRGTDHTNSQVADLKTINAMNAPKVSTVNEQVRGTGDAPTQVIDLKLENAMNAPKVGTINEQVRGTGDAPTQGIDLKLENAMNAPKVGTINEQVRGTGDAPTQGIDLKMETAMNAPKVATINEQVRLQDASYTANPNAF